MHFKLDENMPAEAAVVFQDAGFAASTVLAEELAGTSDRSLSEVCQEEGFALVTLDLDFADIRTYPPGEFRGILVLRLLDQRKAQVVDSLKRALALLKREPLEARLWIVEETTIRVRSG